MSCSKHHGRQNWIPLTTNISTGDWWVTLDFSAASVMLMISRLVRSADGALVAADESNDCGAGVAPPTMLCTLSLVPRLDMRSGSLTLRWALAGCWSGSSKGQGDYYNHTSNFRWENRWAQYVKVKMTDQWPLICQSGCGCAEGLARLLDHRGRRWTMWKLGSRILNHVNESSPSAPSKVDQDLSSGRSRFLGGSCSEIQTKPVLRQALT